MGKKVLLIFQFNKSDFEIYENLSQQNGQKLLKKFFREFYWKFPQKKNFFLGLQILKLIENDLSLHQQ